MRKQWTAALVLMGVVVLAVVGGQGRVAAAQSYVYNPHIYAVSHNAGDSIKTGETLEVTARAEKGLKLTFDLGDSVTGVPMKEVEPGRYVGTYQMEPRIYIHTRVWVVVRAYRGQAHSDMVAARPLVLEP